MHRKTSSRPAGVTALFAALIGATLLLTACERVIGPQAEFTTTPTFDYPPLEVTLDASASSSPNGAIVSYDWDLGDGDTDSGVRVTHTYTEKGVYDITLVVTDSTGEIGARTHSVEALNRVPVAIFTFSPYYVAANADSATFDASDSYDPDGVIVQYIWSFGDGSSGEGMIVEHMYTTAGGSGWKPTVTLTVVDENGGSSSTSKQINVVGCDSCG
jgi:PKD repeat protein